MAAVNQAERFTGYERFIWRQFPMWLEAALILECRAGFSSAPNDSVPGKLHTSESQRPPEYVEFLPQKFDASESQRLRRRGRGRRRNDAYWRAYSTSNDTVRSGEQRQRLC